MTKFVSFDNGMSYLNVDQIERIESSGTPEEPTTDFYLSDGTASTVYAPIADVAKQLDNCVILEDA